MSECNCEKLTGDSCPTKPSGDRFISVTLRGVTAAVEQECALRLREVYEWAVGWDDTFAVREPPEDD